MPLILSVLFLILLLAFPSDCLFAAQEAFSLWQQTAAPSLLPFFAVIPALTAPEASKIWARLLKIPCRMLGLPGETGGAAGIALAAGSPAGARALLRIAQNTRLTQGERYRAALLCAGVSPGFLISGVGAGMLRDPSAGAVLALAQVLALLTACLMMRPLKFPEITVKASVPEENTLPAVPFAVQGVLQVWAWMTLFSVLSALLRRLLPDACAAPVRLLMEFSGGCRYACMLSLPKTKLLPLLGAVVGFGGVCAGCQNLSLLRRAGISVPAYFAGKCLHASLCALYCRALCGIRLPGISFAPKCVLPVLASVCTGILLLRIGNSAFCGHKEADSPLESPHRI